MKRFKKFLSVTLSLILALSALTMLSGFSLFQKTVRVQLFPGGTISPAAQKAVMTAANARLKQLKLNFKVELLFDGPWASDKAQTALDTGNRNVDIVLTNSWTRNNYVQYAQKGAYLQLDEVIDNKGGTWLSTYGKDMYNAVPKSLWDSFTLETVNGTGIYGVPGVKDYAQQYAWDINNTRLAELGISYDSFTWNDQTMFDPAFEAALKAAKAKYGTNFYPLMVESGVFARQMSNADGDLTGLGVYYFGFDPQDPSKPESASEVGLFMDNAAYKKVLDKLRYFYQQGYIDPVCAITGEGTAAVQAARTSGNYLFSSGVSPFGTAESASKTRGIDVKMPSISKAIVSTNSAQGNGYAVSIYSKNYTESVQFLNAWYTDSELATILCYGVENTHWKQNKTGENAGTITRTEKGLAEYQTWRNGMGNIFILPPNTSAGEYPGFMDKFKAFNAAGVGTAFNGFTFNPKPVETEIAVLKNVVEEYQGRLDTGASDPAALMTEYKAKLTANGLQKVTDELNKQVKAYFASKKK